MQIKSKRIYLDAMKYQIDNYFSLSNLENYYFTNSDAEIRTGENECKAQGKVFPLQARLWPRMWVEV
jgi:hypothetical protein